MAAPCPHVSAPTVSTRQVTRRSCQVCSYADQKPPSSRRPRHARGQQRDESHPTSAQPSRGSAAVEQQGPDQAEERPGHRVTAPVGHRRRHPEQGRERAAAVARAPTIEAALIPRAAGALEVTCAS